MAFKSGAKVIPSKISEALGKKYTLAKVAATMEGELAYKADGEEAGLWFIGRSGQKFLLVNRPKKDDKDEVEDVAGALKKELEAGKTQAKVEGVIVEADGKISLQVEKGEATEPKK